MRAHLQHVKLASVRILVNGKPSGDFEVFAQGFAGKTPLMQPNDAVARADGVAEAPDGSLYIGESNRGKIWHVVYRGGK